MVERSYQKLLRIYHHHVIIPAILYHFKLSWRPEFYNLSFFHDQNFIRTSQSRESMSDCQDSTVFELLSDYFLVDGIVFNINISCGFIYKHYFTVLEKGSTDAKQLFLACWETVIRHRCLKTSFFHDGFIEVALFKNLVEVFVRVSPCNVKVFFESRLD